MTCKMTAVDSDIGKNKTLFQVDLPWLTEW